MIEKVKRINYLTCPVCGGNEFEDGSIAPAYGGGGKVIYMDSDYNSSNIKIKCCKKCGHILMFKRVKK